MTRTLHVCWFVDAWAPSRQRYIDAWRAAGWELVLWHCGQLGDIRPQGVELRQLDFDPSAPFDYEHHHGHHAACADLFRYTVLAHHGGAYVDIDVLPGPACTPEQLASRTLPAFGRLTEGRHRVGAFEIRFIYAAGPEHRELFTALSLKACDNTERFRAQGGYTRHIDNIMLRTGPAMARSVVKTYADTRGLSIDDFLLSGATDDNTPENTREHYMRKWPEIQRVARQDARGTRG